MGQRLNIEIHDDGKCIANAYYHWSAYTCSAAELTRKILNRFFNAESIGGVPLAVELLQSTKAGIDPDERNRINNDESGKYSNIEFVDCIDRNTGLLAVTTEGMAETRKWEEGRVVVNIDTETVEFGVYIILDRGDDHEDRHEDMKAPDEFIAKFFEWPVPFDEFLKLSCDLEKYTWGDYDDEYILSWIY